MRGGAWWGASFRLKHLNRIATWCFLFATLGLVRWSKGAGFSDFFALLSRPFWPGSAQQEWIQSGSDLELRSKLNLIEKDNQRLRKLLSLQSSSKNDRVSATVISRTSKGWWQKLELSKGSMHGIRPEKAVMGPGGLIGRVVSVTPTTARVRLLTAPGSRIGVWAPRTKRHGMLLGMGTSRPQLIFFDNDPQVLPGDLVSTSPASILFPPNLPVGVIQSFDKKVWPSPKAMVQLTASPEAIDWVQIQLQ